ncbi:MULTISPECIES: NAD(P)H-quinone oxidoreductase [unclassified Mycolicibacterium]|uniref:NAD(P)H-quinone oxidoreductase n=1 Tax=unclassified Mycolicibacterium TaxID=2636767 RepID=UPI0012DBE748|nr:MULTISPECIES: NAD(P)H-quinone oxidoreductase [unclassified Mycolicibacterium]MUL84333.1 NAD(P)H-quinone oxidoreductase [Mycolicibacterium sp. CBMA 329]MUL89601.1 NAD(P)H-quinone oxidoreductase [Mycolicibacterium sp. CBMA 331]MUL99777.1 NAD(P)H-quinone oxidoreductase [Mycolicibacterium sp. CBMA 334]MUM29584.1 NAD(P)H-quinone oxidoreductase [Mycolicibacterium sp. CBMA 295]MUM39116.1 NAD(P)H-quinone oxidoreductase [Mycolicibacterium sp. CBMA 247]
MYAIAASADGHLTWENIADITAANDEILIRVRAAGVNRADLLQAAGKYPPPPGASAVIGLEVSGTVAALGADITDWSVGQPVCALLAGGGYAEYVSVPAAQVLPLPDGVALRDAAALPEVACTVWSNLVSTAGLTAGQLVLLHGGASGIGTHATQVARALGARVAVTAGSADKLALCRELGADITINYRDEDFVKRIRAETGGSGADVILDIMGAAYLDRNVDALADGGRLVIIGMQGGIKGELNIAKLIGKRAGVIGTALRSRPVDGPGGKAKIVTQVAEKVWPMIADGRVRPIIGAELPIEQAQRAHELLASGEVSGKILLTVPE